MRSSVDRSGWIGLRWGAIGLGGLIFGGDAISVVVRDIWQRQCQGAIGNSLFFLSLYLSLYASDPKMVCSENRNLKPFPDQDLILHGQLKRFHKKFYFSYTVKHALRLTPKQTKPRSFNFVIHIAEQTHVHCIFGTNVTSINIKLTSMRCKFGTSINIKLTSLHFWDQMSHQLILNSHPCAANLGHQLILNSHHCIFGTKCHIN